MWSMTGHISNLSYCSFLLELHSTSNIPLIKQHQCRFCGLAVLAHKSDKIKLPSTCYAPKTWLCANLTLTLKQQVKYWNLRHDATDTSSWLMPLPRLTPTQMKMIPNGLSETPPALCMLYIHLICLSEVGCYSYLQEKKTKKQAS